MKNLLLTLTLTAIASSAFAQITDGSRWDDYTASVQGGKITLQSPDGTVQLVKDGLRYYSQSESFDSEYKTFIIDGKKQAVLRVFTDNDFCYTILENISLEEKLQESFRDMLEGTYTDAQGKKYTFTREACIVGGKTMPYTLWSDWKESGCISFDGHDYMAEFSMEGLKLCKIEVDNDLLHPGDVLISLKADISKPRFAFTSKHLVARSQFEIRSSKELRLMRNEIYARHGYTFSSADLQKYFGSKPWYKPLNNNATVKLSDIETFNVELLKNMEDMAKFEERAN